MRVTGALGGGRRARVRGRITTILRARRLLGRMPSVLNYSVGCSASNIRLGTCLDSRADCVEVGRKLHTRVLRSNPVDLRSTILL